MALYEEKNVTPFCGVLLLLLSFLIFFCPWQLGNREFYRHEGLYVAQTLEMQLGQLPMAVAHGVAVKDSAPLYPWLASLLWHCGFSMEYALRILPLICVAVLAGIVYFPTRKAAGNTAGLVAAAFVIGSNLMIEKGVEANALIPALPLILSGQLLWFRYGFLKGDWLRAWAVLGVFGALSFYLAGSLTLWCLLLPLLFMRRPLTIWTKFKRTSVLALGVGFVLVGLLWMLPYWVTPPEKSMWLFSFSDWDNYLWHLFSFPFDVAFRLLPWSIFAWAPFCVAFQWITPTPIFCRFLRTIVISLFFFLWLNPATEARDILVLAAPLAILTGINYALTVRRYGNTLLWLLNFLTPFAWLLGLGIVCFFAWPSAEEWFTQFDLSYSLSYVNEWFYQVQGIAGGAVIAVGSLLVMRRRKKPPIWAYLLGLSGAVMLFWWCVAVPYRAQMAEKRDFAAMVRKGFEGEKQIPAVIYKYNISNLYGEFHYVGCPIRTIDSLDELPATKEPIYLLAPEYPQYMQREWQRLLPPDASYRGKKIYLLRGDSLAPEDSFDLY